MNSILSRFPNIEIPYESMTHKKLHNVIYVSRPVGLICFMWFTYYKDQNVCFLYNPKKKTIEPVITSFNSDLSLGTILHGTICNKKGVQCFLIDNIFYYKGRPCNVDYAKKLDYFKEVLESISPVIHTKKQIMFKLPHMGLDPPVHNDYNIYNIRMINLYGKTNYYKYQTDDKIFIVKPTIKSDIYELYDLNNKFNSYAFVNTYKCSVMMNDLFRKVFENHNLDLIEESDSEEDFENTNEDKYVFMDRSYKMKCSWNNKLKKWIPISII